MTTVRFDTFADAVAASAPSPLPDDVFLYGYTAPGDGGASHYRLARDGSNNPIVAGGMPTLGSQLLVDGSFTTDPTAITDTPWTLVNCTWSGGVINGSALSETITYDFRAAGATNPLPAPGKAVRWRVTIGAAGDPGNLVATVLNLDAGKSRSLGSVGYPGTNTLIFYIREGDYGLSLSGSTTFNRTIDDFWLVEYTDQGQASFFGYTYLPVPLDWRADAATPNSGILTPEMFRAGTTSSDDDAFRRLVLRTNNLMAAGYAPVIEAHGRYKCSLAYHELFVPQGRDISIDFGTSGFVDLSGGSIVRAEPWLSINGLTYAGTKTRLTAAVAEGATDITVADTTGFSIGDWLAVTSTHQYWNGVSGIAGYGIAYAGEMAQIREITNSAALSLGSGLLEHYDLAADPVADPVNVRKLQLGGTCLIRNFRAYGPGDGQSEIKEGDEEYLRTAAISPLSITGFEQILVEKSHCENFKGSSIVLAIYVSAKVDSPATFGRDYTDPTNTTPVSERFYGIVLQGGISAAVNDPDGKYCRRSVDCGFANLVTYLSDSTVSAEGLICGDVVVTGGVSFECENAPGGHEVKNFSLVNHIARNVKGMTLRGKNYNIVGLRMSSGGIGIGGYITTDPSTYPETPYTGRINIVDCELGDAIKGRASFESLRVVNTRVRAKTPIQLIGKNQSHVTVLDSDLEGDGTNPLIWFRYQQKLSGSDVTIRGNRLANGTYGILHEGSATETISDIEIDDNVFEDISTAHVSLSRGTTLDWETDGSLRIVNNRQRGTPPATAVDSGGLIVSRYGNEFGDSYYTLTAASGVISLPAHGDVPLREIRISEPNPSAAQTITAITGAQEGRILTVRIQGSYPVTLDSDASGGNLKLGSDITLTSVSSRVGMIYSGGAWRLLFSAL
ncbi:hypothetical protein LGR54_05020 [Ancylobacter sp. Lp-2]|uniref:hypothetical protein n=1 Tax=Ancylobacter sp. Lp-2 TaxID=2881339 RepID=UPI001E34EDEC|nr:hypothetical protein [Ancylobacter sp. Lp-2]MCB4767958.1 hypothetical protein [Ancylobacter sp. Lp-2]